MSTPAEHADPAAAQGAPSEAELRAAYEAELSRITSVDMVLQAAASLLNIGAHRLGLTGAGAGAGAPADLAQVRDAIDAVNGLLPVIERSAPAELRPLRDALAQLQMAYTRAAQSAPAAAAPEATPAGPVAPAGPVGPAGPAAPAGAGGEPGAAQSHEARPGAAQPGATQPGATQPPGTQPAPGAGEQGHRPGPAESSGRLWVPGR
jgi:hypothetical protein